ncbi:glycosyltransferase family 9 protein [Candidatus Pacearchaeota archaeon]|jgi:ADP-heptose:LPS heptosyltransferase|nr:glycosyltransferase family 9 protein [Candidatus Pacearchaeota archaeon]
MRGTLFAGVNLIGDALATTPAVREWRLNHPDEPVWYVAQDQPISRVLRKNPYVDRVILDPDHDKIRRMVGWGNWTKKWLFDVGAAFSYGERRNIHMAQAYGELLGVQIGSCRPELRIVDAERSEAEHILGPMSRFVAVCPHSMSSTGLDTANREGNKLWGDSRWRELVLIIQEMGFSVVSLGGPDDPKIFAEDTGVVELHGLPIRIAAAVMDAADYVVTIDSGLAHVAAALNKNLVEIYPAVLHIEWVYPHTTHKRVIQGYPPEIPVAKVADELEALVGECEGKPKKGKKTDDPIMMPFNAVDEDPIGSAGIASFAAEARNDGEADDVLGDGQGNNDGELE